MTSTGQQSPETVAPTGSSLDEVSGDDAAMRAWAEELVARARDEGVELTGDNGLLTALVRRVLQTGLEVEMTDHVGYETDGGGGPRSGNQRNGNYPKNVTNGIGQGRLPVPPERKANLDPV